MGTHVSYEGKQQLTMVFKAPTPALVAEGDRLFASHAAWMAKTHPRTGALALLHYSVSKAPEFSNLLDPTSAPTGAVYFAVTEIYETIEGVGNHWKIAQETWADFGAMVGWLQQCESTIVHGCPVIHSV